MGALVLGPPTGMEQLDLPPLLEWAFDVGGGAEAGQGNDDEDLARLRREGDVGPLLAAPAALEEQAHVEPGHADQGQLVPAPRAARASFPDVHGRTAYARAKQALKRATAKAKSAEIARAGAVSDLALASAVLPGVGQLLGQQVQRKRLHCRNESDPKDYCALALAMFLPLRLQMNVGVNRKRLVAAGERLVQLRQDRALAMLLANARLFRRPRLQEARAPRELAVVCYTHEWDESRMIFRRHEQTSTRKLRVTGSGTWEQTLVQRGSVNVCCSTGADAKVAIFKEEWIVPPKVVSGTSTTDIAPGVHAALPSALCVYGPQAPERLKEATSCFDIVVFQPIGDKAASNLSLMKVWGMSWSSLPAELRKQVLLFPDTCAAHAHHRAKLRLAALRHHTTRHFSLTHLYRLPSVQRRLVGAVERQVAQGLVRKLQEPPPESEQWRVFVDVLYHLEDGRHDRKVGSSALHAGLQELLKMANGNPASGRMEHFCRDSSGKACCPSDEACRERFTVAALNVFMSTDALPCESRWTNLLPGMKKTLIRKVFFELGTLAFLDEPEQAIMEHAPAGDDAAAHAEYLQQVNGVRAQRTRDYYNQPKTFAELGVLTVILDTVDELLYAILGGVDRKGVPCKLEALLDADKSLVGKVLAGLLHLLDTWASSDVLRRPLCVLHMVKAPHLDLGFAKWARSQVLCMAASMSRRFEFKLAAWPYPLFKLIAGGWSEGDKTLVAQAFCASPACCLGVFATGVRERFPARDAVRSPLATTVLTAAFSSHRVTTDWCERQHAEVTAARPSRGAAREFVHFARENTLKQARVVHLTNGGQDPARPARVRGPAEPCQALVMPLLKPLLVPLAGAGDLRDLAPAAPNAEEEHRPMQVEGAAPVGAPVGEGAAALTDIAPAGSALLAMAPVSLEGCIADPPAEPAEPPQKKRGLSPFLMFKNSLIKAAKTAKKASLTPEELATLAVQAKERWASMPDHTPYQDLYQAWRESPPTRPPTSDTEPYMAMWGGGTKASPVSAMELYRFHKEIGWPSDADVYHSDKFHTKPEEVPELNDSRNFPLWGCAVCGSGVCQAQLEHPRDFALVHKGMCNYLESMSREAAESGNTMIMVQGTRRGAPSQVFRQVVIIAGVSWSPKFFDAVLCKFGDADHEQIAELPPSFECCIMRRADNRPHYPFLRVEQRQNDRRVPPTCLRIFLCCRAQREAYRLGRAEGCPFRKHRQMSGAMAATPQAWKSKQDIGSVT